MWKAAKKSVAPGSEFVVLLNPRVRQNFEVTINITSTGLSGVSDSVNLEATVSDFGKIDTPNQAIWFSLMDSEIESLVVGDISTANVGIEFPVTAVRFKNEAGSAYPYIIEVLNSGA
jgi:hypothetical protein